MRGLKEPPQTFEEADRFVKGCLHRKISRLLTLEDAIDIAGRGTVLVDPIGCVGDQPPPVTM
jgi:hypothetical protein